jgi:hypothetical protein
VSEPKPKSFEISKWAVWEANLWVRANKGAAGVDEQSVAEFERDLKGNLYKLWNRLSSGSYMPPPVRAVEIPKRVCNQPAGWGTPYGHGRCKLHGGATPTHLRAAQRREAERAVASLGLPREVEPHTALLEEVHRAAGHVAWLAEVVGQLDQSQIVHGITRTVQAADGTRTVEARATVNVWVRLYQEWHDRLVRVAKTAIDAGVEERQVRLAEAQAQRLAAVIRAILTDLGYDLEEENVRKVVRLRLLEGGKA